MEKEIYSKEFKKKGWQKMNDILDHEMPVKKRRWIHILFLFFILSSLVIGYSINKSNSTVNVLTLNSEIKRNSNKQNKNINIDQYAKSKIPINHDDKNIKLNIKDNIKANASTIKK